MNSKENPPVSTSFKNHERMEILTCPGVARTPASRYTLIAVTILLAMFGSLMISELVLRFVWHNPYRFELPDHVIKLRMHHPNTNQVFSRSLVNPEQPHGQLRTDNRSYIIPSFQYKDPDATIAFLGGSTTECSAVQEDLRFPALASQLLADRDLKVNTLNAARSGNALHDSINVFFNHVVQDRPDIVVLMHASNDIGVLAAQGDYRSRSGMSVTVQDLSKWVLQMVSSRLYLGGLLRQSLTSSVIRPSDPQSDWRNDPSAGRNIPDAMFRERLRTFIHMARDFDIQPVVMTQPFSDATNALTPNWTDEKAQNRFNALIRDVAKAEEVPLVDLVKYLQESVPQWNKPMEIFYDAIHVTDKGSTVYANHIAEQLLPLVRAVARGRQSTAHTH